MNFLYLNVDNQWPEFDWDGLEVGPDGSLGLVSLPLLEVELPQPEGGLPLPAVPGPAGMAVDEYGTIYCSDPDTGQIFRQMEPGNLHEVHLLANGQTALFTTPRGVWVSAATGRLWVADSGNHRIQIFELDSLQLIAMLGSPATGKPLQPSSEAGYFNVPTGLTGDAAGNIYVVDTGNHRIQKFDVLGNVQPDFWMALGAADLLEMPVGIGVRETGNLTHLYILDAKGKIFIVDAEGQPVRGQDGEPLWFGVPQEPLGIAVADNTVYVGDTVNHRILTFKKMREHWVFAGEAVGYAGPVMGLTLDGKGNLWAYWGKSGLDPRPVLAPLALNKGFQTTGKLWSRPLSMDSTAVNWQRLQAQMLLPGPACHLQFFLYTTEKAANPPPDPANDDEPFQAPWQPLAADLGDHFIGSRPSPYLWLGAQLVGDGRTTPRLSQIRLDFDGESYLRFLPAVYSEDEPADGSMTRLLALLQSFMDDLDAQIEGLSTYFDLGAARAEIFPWLAGWLGLPWRQEFVRMADESEAAFEARKLQWNWVFLKAAQPLLPYRGTLPGLEALLRAWLKGELVEALPPPLILTDLTSFYVDVETIFQLAPEQDEDEVPGETYGQVGVTTVLGEGPPFFFIVDLILDPQVRELHHPVGIETLERAARFLLDLEKPAHTKYELRLRARALTMQLAPAVDHNRKSGEIYARVGETTLLWEGL